MSNYVNETAVTRVLYLVFGGVLYRPGTLCYTFNAEMFDSDTKHLGIAIDIRRPWTAEENRLLIESIVPLQLPFGVTFMDVYRGVPTFKRFAPLDVRESPVSTDT